jgi:hypothetical protein
MALALDAAVFGNQAAGASPAGILNTLTPLTPVAGGGLNALEGDLRALTAALVAAGAGRNPALVVNPVQNTSLTLLAGPHFKIPIWPSNAIAVGTVIMVEPSSFASAFAPTPEFEISSHAMVQFQDAPTSDPMAGTPTKSLWQTDSIAWRTTTRGAWGMSAARGGHQFGHLVNLMDAFDRARLAELYREDDRLRREHAEFLARREAAEAAPEQKSDRDDLLYREHENNAPSAAAPERDEDDDAVGMFADPQLDRAFTDTMGHVICELRDEWRDEIETERTKLDRELAALRGENTEVKGLLADALSKVARLEGAIDMLMSFIGQRAAARSATEDNAIPDWRRSN